MRAENADRRIGLRHTAIAPALCSLPRKGGNVTAQIFWLKTRAHWRERLTADDPIPNADAEPNSEVVLVLPDNSRDPELTQVLQDAQRKYFVRKRQR